MAIEGTGHNVLLLTREVDRRPLPLPVAQRLELSRTAADKLTVRLAKDQRGRISQPRPVAWSRGSAWDETTQPEAANVRRFG
jgi:recombination protein RecA